MLHEGMGAWIPDLVRDDKSAVIAALSRNPCFDPIVIAGLTRNPCLAGQGRYRAYRGHT